MSRVDDHGREYGFFCLPETKDRTLEELDVLFEQKAPTRKFEGYDTRLVIGAKYGQKSS